MPSADWMNTGNWQNAKIKYISGKLQCLCSHPMSDISYTNIGGSVDLAQETISDKLRPQSCKDLLCMCLTLCTMNSPNDFTGITLIT